MDVVSRLALVTGAGSGLGFEIALALGRRGAAVAVVDRDEVAAQEACDAIRAVGAQAWPYDVDLRDASAVAGLVREVAVLGRLGVLVNNAGGWTEGEQYPLVPLDAWEGTLLLNLRAPMLLTQLCLSPMLAAGGGVVVNVSSSAALGTLAYGSPEYAAAKAGLIRLTTSLTDLPTTHGIRVTCVVPDWIGLDRAHQQLAAMSAEERAAAPALIPPEDVVAVVLGLIEDDSASGRVVEMHGGEPPRVVAG
jgi:NAD(P)-dependent dehydrogenase (short-subunit alcohol dehydrogenase family)